MEIKCSKCETVNSYQKYCGNCGHQILYTEDEISKEHKLKDTQKSKIIRWLIGFGVFLIIWFLGSAFLEILAESLGLNITYIGGIAFIIGVITMILIGITEPSKDDE